MTPARTRTRRAFSLMELLVAIALVLALLGALFAFFWDMLSTREQVLEATSRQRRECHVAHVNRRPRGSG